MASAREELARLRATGAKDAPRVLALGKELLGDASSKGKTRALGDEGELRDSKRGCDC